jgi:secondary thiamine-phosphate synthase enzyme
MWQQVEIQLPAMRRGFHLITDQIEAALRNMSPVSIGLLHVQLLHTSASLSINENADPSVRRDMERSGFPVTHSRFKIHKILSD